MTDRHVAGSLETLKLQIDAACPLRSKDSDGSIGDASHQLQGSASDHNPWYNNTVTARDFTHDPLHGLDCDVLFQELRQCRDRRIKYAIRRNQMFSSYSVNRNVLVIPAWTIREYTGEYHNHLHVSVVAQPICEDRTPWMIVLPTRPPYPGRILKLTNPYMRGNDIKQWQTQMRNIGYQIVYLDGIYGPISDKVCRYFQHDHGLVIDGKVGPITWAASFAYK